MLAQTIKDELVKNGLNARKAAVYGKFAHNAINLINQAYLELSTPIHWADFRANETANRNVEEPDITSMLDKYCGELLHEPYNSDIRKHIASVTSERPIVNSRTRSGKWSKKVDLCVTRTLSCHLAAGNRVDHELVFEAKPLKSSADIKTRYLAGEGIGCFLTTDSPYSTGPIGGMLAYCFNKNIADWFDLIEDGLAKSDCSDGAPIIIGHKENLISKHSRTKEQDITIIHGLLNFMDLH